MGLHNPCKLCTMTGKDAEMAPEEENNSSTVETTDQEQQGQQQANQGETPPAESQQASTPQEPVRLSEDHPLVKTLAANKLKLSEQATALREAQAQAAKATKLEEELQARPTQESVETLQTRYDRLEAFAQAVGLGRALDSRQFTRDLFESDKDIKDLVKEWNQANPSATAAALSATAGGNNGTKKPDANELIRIAAGRGA